MTLLWPVTLLDLAITAALERQTQLRRRLQMSPKSIVLVVALLVLALWTGYLNTHTDELLVVVPWLLVATLGLGLARPRQPWLWALLLGLAVPVSQGVFHVLGLRVPYPNDLSSIITSGLVLVPSFLGAYLGAGIRRLAR